MAIKSLVAAWVAFAALALAANATNATNAAEVSGVTIELRMTAPDALEASYILPPDCTRLAFDKHGGEGAHIRATWQPLDQCGSADGDALLRKDASCNAVRLRVPVSAERRPGYPAAFPLGDAIYVHTSNFAVGPQCGPVSYRFIAPADLALQGRVARRSADVFDATAGGDMAVLLSAAPLAATPEGIRYYAPGLGDANVAQIDRVARGTIAYLKSAMPDAPFNMPVLAAARVMGPGGTGIDGDAADVLRIGLVNWPMLPSAAQQAQLTLLVSHEFSHRFQLRDAFDSYTDGRLIHEGGAEFLRWVVSLQNGWLSREEAGRVLDDALAECLLATGARHWRALSPREIGNRRLAYSCGLPAYTYSLAARQGGGTALARFSGLYRSVQAGQQPDFAHALECGGNAACKARWLPALLEKELPLRQAFANLFEATALARPTAATPSQHRLMLLQAFERLMTEDCGGASYYPGDNVIIVDDHVTCRALKGGMRIRQVEGRTLSGDTGNSGAVQAMSDACTQRKQVRLGLEQGDVVDVACSKPYDAGQRFYQADMAALLAALKLPPAPAIAVKVPAALALPHASSAAQ